MTRIIGMGDRGGPATVDTCPKYVGAAKGHLVKRTTGANNEVTLATTNDEVHGVVQTLGPGDKIGVEFFRTGRIYCLPYETAPSLGNSVLSDDQTQAATIGKVKGTATKNGTQVIGVNTTLKKVDVAYGVAFDA